MDKAQMQKERARLQAALDRYNGHRPSLSERIANLDLRIAAANA